MPIALASILLARWRLSMGILAVTWLCVPVSAQIDSDIAGRGPLLKPWTTLNGAFIAKELVPPGPSTRRSEFAGYLTWQVPSIVAVRGHYIFVFDSGRRQIFRYDSALQNMMPFAEHFSGGVTSMAVAADFSLYVSDAGSNQVLHFSVDGRLLQRISNDFDMTRPAAVVPDERTGHVWVADSLRNHVLVFNPLGRILAAWRPPSARSIEAMAAGPDGLYLVDRMSRQIVVIGLDGVERYTLGGSTLKMPDAIAVDRFNRVFVSDAFDNSIRVYEQGQWIGNVGGSGTVPASFNRISSLAIDHNTLFVADSLNARIQTFQLIPPRRNASSHD